MIASAVVSVAVVSVTDRRGWFAETLDDVVKDGRQEDAEERDAEQKYIWAKFQTQLRERDSSSGGGSRLRGTMGPRGSSVP
jgi:hypothetical protein